ncbi:MAG: hypothetical protein RR101_13910 [Burkholderiaceae bacterium]
MPAIAGQLARATAGGISNPYLTSAHDSFAWVAMPFESVAARSPGGAACPRAFPVAANGRVIQVKKCGAFVDDFYDRIHLAPALLELGNIVSTQTSQISLWNAYRVAQTLTGIDGLEEGLAVAGSSGLPRVIAALQETTWNVSVTPDGPSTLNAVLTWSFTGLPSPSLTITGNRIVAWGFTPDWSEPVTESLTWLTDVLTSTSGAEQRRSLRLAPRRAFKARILAEGRERAFFDLALAGWGAKQWALPVWADGQWLAAALPVATRSIDCQTAHRDFVAGGLALLRGVTAFDTEAVEIEAITAAGLTLKRPTQIAWPAGSRLYPVRSARLAEQPEMARHTDRLLSVDVTFDVTEPCDWPARAPATLYRGHPVFEARPDESQDLSSTYERLLVTLDNTMGKPVVTDTARRAFPVRDHRWVLQGAAERAAFRSLIYALHGRQRAVWLPTHADDLRFTEIAKGSLLTVERIGYARFGLNQLGRRDIRIELVDGTVLHRRITAAAEADGNTEALVIDTELPAPIAPADVGRISFMALMRPADDAVEIEHLADVDGVARSSLTWRGVRDDLEQAA